MVVHSLNDSRKIIIFKLFSLLSLSLHLKIYFGPISAESHEHEYIKGHKRTPQQKKKKKKKHLTIQRRNYLNIYKLKHRKIIQEYIEHARMRTFESKNTYKSTNIQT